MSPRPSGGASVGLDVAAIREAVGERDIFTGALAVVEELPEANDDGDWDVEVKLHQNAAPVTATLSGQWGGTESGVWVGVEVGQECLLVFPDGDYEATPVIAGFLPTTGGDVGALPPEMLDGRTMRADRVVIVASADVLILTTNPGKVQIGQRGGAFAPVATLADITAQQAYTRQQFDLSAGHVHPLPGGPPVTVGPNTGTPTVPPPTPAGTQIVELE